MAQRLDQAAKEQPLTQELERIAREQDRLADAMERDPNNATLKEQQRELQERLDKVIKEHPELQKPATAAHQAQQEELVKQIQELERQQQPLGESLKNQADAPATKEQVKSLGQKQSELNREIEAFRQQHAQTLKDAGAKTPDKPTLDKIVKDLQSDHLDSAAQSQRASGVQLDEAASRLETAEKREQEGAAARDKALQQAQEAAKEAGALQSQAEQLARQIEQAKSEHNPPTRPSDPANQQAGALADEMKKAAQQMSQTPAFKQAAQDAAKAADAAKREAGQGNAAAAAAAARQRRGGACHGCPGGAGRCQSGGQSSRRDCYGCPGVGGEATGSGRANGPRQQVAR